MVTHSSTNRPVQCLCMAERTGCPVLTDLWSYVQVGPPHRIYMQNNSFLGRLSIGPQAASWVNDSPRLPQ
jgi:hypothetical protein